MKLLIIAVLLMALIGCCECYRQGEFISGTDIAGQSVNHKPKTVDLPGKTMHLFGKV
ncbi:MAG: hypothetical protein LBS47_01460 [Endomicrobium sp.]|jgi:hypothetical protein|nr:hypothetical protein [Endomicrobium sp.]